jgi:xanthine dehydrogenase accessory factor
VKDLFRKIADEKLGNSQFALCIVVKTNGSTPRSAGAKMLVFKDGDSYGTIGGGKIEKKIIEDALNVLQEKCPILLHYDLLKDLGMSCGGSMDIYIEPHLPMNRLLIFGAGHVGFALAQRAIEFDYDVTLIDNRAEYIDRIQGNSFRKLTGEYNDILPTLVFNEKTYITILTYSHTIDKQILGFCLGKPYAYLGMMGSHRKTIFTKRLLIEESPLNEDLLQNVDMPIGIGIKAEGPDEISISILAKLISVKNKKAVNGK